MTEEEAFAAAVERGAFAGMSMPYQRKEVLAEGVTLYLGDMARVLPTLPRFDAIVTDPPYGIGKDGQAKTTGGHGGRKAYDFKGWDRERPAKDIFNLILSASKQQVIWGGNYFADFLPATGKWLVWDKGQRINQSDGELAYTSEDGALRIFTQNRVALLVEGAEHPTQKPLEVMRWSLQQVPNALTICDPFCGSGSTGVAAVNLGRKFTGIEIDPGYFDIACRRIEAALKEPDLFIAPPKPAEQTSLPLSPTSGAA
jgi:site-specific DNA-methyltransferase (adenine-specific)